MLFTAEVAIAFQRALEQLITAVVELATVLAQVCHLLFIKRLEAVQDLEVLVAACASRLPEP
jgi:hypothetical protein